MYLKQSLGGLWDKDCCTDTAIESSVGNTCHRENSPVTQSAQSSHCWAGVDDHTIKKSPPLATLQTRSYQATQTLLFWNPLMLLRRAAKSNLLKISSDMVMILERFFSSTSHVDLKVESNYEDQY